MSKTRFVLIFTLALLSIFGLLYTINKQKSVTSTDDWKIGTSTELLTEVATVEEVSAEDSPDTGWWVNSGGIFKIKDKIGETIQGDLDANSKWAKTYATTNSLDTDRGTHPQNIFRLIYRNNLPGVEQRACFLINQYNLSLSENRNQSNGFFFLNRYRDGDNLYYTGVRVDGELVIKKKINGVYTTLASKKIFDGIYNRSSNPNLIPIKQWIGLKSRVFNTDNGTRLELFLDSNCRGEWVSELTTEDKNQPLTTAGDIGIRGDFMDIKFKDYQLREILKKN